MEPDIVWLMVSVYAVVGSVALSVKFPTPLNRAGIVLTAIAGAWGCLNVLVAAMHVAGVEVPLALVFGLGITGPVFLVWMFLASPCRWVRSSPFIRKPGVYYNQDAGKPLVRAR
jgi:hypothetical protein